MENVLRHVVPLVIFACLGCIQVGCSQALVDARPDAATSDAATSDAATSDKWLPRPVDQSHLPNAYRLHTKVLSGGQPAGDDGFRELRELGVKTVISVDGAQPALELARKHGLRYVHLPHGYDGVSETRARELAKAVRDLPGPIYIHCHHGKHRSPVAATVACVGAGLLRQDQGLSVLRTAGTSENYQGLYDSVAKARRFDNQLLDALSGEFPETVQVPPMAELMVAVERAHDHLHAIQRAGWQSPADHPDLDPPHEALLLREHFTELLRTAEVLSESAEFQRMLRDSETAAAQLEEVLRRSSGHGAPTPGTVNDSFKRITTGCQTCHRRFRDVPLHKKLSLRGSAHQRDP